MRQYLYLLEYILDNGLEQKNERTGVGTRFVWGSQLHFDLTQGFPLVTTKRIHFKSVIHELLWMISGQTNIRYLNQHQVRIWNEWPFRHYLKATNQEVPPPHSPQWKEKMSLYTEQILADEEFANNWGSIGLNYGYQWRHFDKTVDQLGKVVEEIKAHSSSRRLLVTAWDPRVIKSLEETSLPPCHFCYQFKVHDNMLYSVVTLRSWDVFLGGPFNIAQYALLTHMIAHIAGLTPAKLVVESHDTHLYLSHIEAAKIQLSRDLRPLPRLSFTRPVDSIDDFHYEDIDLQGYNPHDHIKGDIAV